MKQFLLLFFAGWVSATICLSIATEQRAYQTFRANSYKYMYDKARDELMKHEIAVLPLSPDDTEMLKLWKGR